MKKSRIKLLQLLSIFLIILSVSACTPVSDCGNGIKDGNETGIDCGGDCPACAPEATCSDGIMNGTETSIDCGGTCSPCVAAPTCSDGIMNGTETGVDCGGICAPCYVVGSSMYGTYNGSFTGPFVFDFAPVVDIDTNFVAPGTPGTVTLAASIYIDSVSVNTKLVVSGTPIDVTVLAHIDSETTYTIPPTKFSYLGAVDMLISGYGSTQGNTLNSNFKATEPSGNTYNIDMDLDFVGAK